MITYPNIPFEQELHPSEKYGNFYKFRVGTVEGLFKSEFGAFDILAIVNHDKGNGHFQVAMQWFEICAKRDGAVIRLLDVFNPRLYYHSVRYHGYKRKPGTLFTLEKSFV